MLQAVVLKKSIYGGSSAFESRRKYTHPVQWTRAFNANERDDEENFLFSFLVYSNIREGNNSIRFLRNSLRWKQLNFSLTIRISLCWNIFTLLVDAVRLFIVVLLLLLVVVATDGNNNGLEKMQSTDVI